MGVTGLGTAVEIYSRARLWLVSPTAIAILIGQPTQIKDFPRIEARQSAGCFLVTPWRALGQKPADAVLYGRRRFAVGTGADHDLSGRVLSPSHTPDRSLGLVFYPRPWL